MRIIIGTGTWSSPLLPCHSAVRRKPQLNCVEHRKLWPLSSFGLVPSPLLTSAYKIFLFSPFFFVCFCFASQGHDDAVPCAVLKSVDSFSFLHHPVHQRSLEILQRCKEEKYSKAPPPALPSDTTLTRPEMGTRCIPCRKDKKTAPEEPSMIKPAASEQFWTYWERIRKSWKSQIKSKPISLEIL